MCVLFFYLDLWYLWSQQILEEKLIENCMSYHYSGQSSRTKKSCNRTLLYLCASAFTRKAVSRTLADFLRQKWKKIRSRLINLAENLDYGCYFYGYYYYTVFNALCVSRKIVNCRWLPTCLFASKFIARYCHVLHNICNHFWHQCCFPIRGRALLSL